MDCVFNFVLPYVWCFTMPSDIYSFFDSKHYEKKFPVIAPEQWTSVETTSTVMWSDFDSHSLSETLELFWKTVSKEQRKKSYRLNN